MAKNAIKNYIEYDVGDLKDVIKEIYQSDPSIVTAIWGPPGIGKTEIHAQICEEYGWKLFDVRLAHFDPIELKGIPVRNGDGCSWLTPDLWPQEKDGPCILFLDEFSNAPPSVQNVALQLLCEKRLHNYFVPKDVRIAIAGNRDEDGGFVNKIGLPTANRMMHFRAKTSFKSVEKYWNTLEGDKKFRPEVLNFLDHRQELLHDIEKAQNDQNCLAFPTPRTWEKLSHLLNRISINRGNKGVSKRDVEMYAAGLVGQGPALEFSNFMEYWVKVRPDKIVIDGEMPKFDDSEVGLMYAATGAVSDFFINKIGKNGVAKLEPKHAKNFMKFVESLPAEYQVRTFIKCEWEKNPKHLEAVHKHATEIYDRFGPSVRKLITQK